MKTEPRTLGSGWKLTMALLTGGLLMLGPGCICINMQVSVPCCAKAPGGGSHGGGPSGPFDMPVPSGGNITPIEMPIIADTGTFTMCNNPAQTVTKVHVNFYPPKLQAPTTGETHFQGRIKNMVTLQYIPKANYVLQWWISAGNQNCATNVPGYPNDKKFPIQSGALYNITAHFKPGFEPTPPLPTIQLEGAWTF